MSPASLAEEVFTTDMLSELRALVSLHDAVITELTDTSRAALREAELVIGGWSAPRISPTDAPKLRALVYLGGVGSTCLNDTAAWKHTGLEIANARSTNAIPVAEYALAMILLDGKDAFSQTRRFSAQRGASPAAPTPHRVGNFRRTVGIVGLSHTAKTLITLLRPFDIDVIAYSPELTPELAAQLGIRAGTLEEVMATSDLVSLHQPLIAATRGQINRSLLARMRDGATLLNTARGAVVDQGALDDELRSGRIRAILDVTDPEPLPAEHDLWALPNVVLTPHIAGSMGSELHRMGQGAIDEVRRFVAGKPFLNRETLQ
ncbi:MAG: hydroxyacid dehydrogenase [Leucobacter sp.]|nr:hydroxyacid dehydrogenase [Leucobacter sp.]